jgi:Fic-DOC domain mobile mystery protein B
MVDSLPLGATPIDPDEAEGLIPDHVTTQGELNELEEANIQEGLKWALRGAFSGREPADVLSESFLYELHEQMFGAVWAWAGKVRLTDKNIGVDKNIVRPEVKKLVDDARYWREHGVYPPEEMAVRFHHQLVSVHPFPNGNGRHARMMADLIAQQSGLEPFSWGGASLAETSALRSAYIDALGCADRGDLRPMRALARS